MLTTNNLRSHYTVRQMVPEDYAEINKLGEDAGFDEGVPNIQLHHQVGGVDKFWVMVKNETGEIVAYSLTHAIDAEGEHDYGYMIYVKKSERGKGLTKLFPTCLGEMGFATEDNWLRYDWPIFRQKVVGYLGEIEPCKLENRHLPAGITIELITSANVKEALDFDAAVIQMDRRLFMSKFLLEPKNFVKSAIARKNDRVVGIGSLRKKTRCTGLGPIYSDGPEIAESIADFLLATLTEKTYIYCPFFAHNLCMMQYCHRLGMVFYECEYSVTGFKQKNIQLLDRINFDKVYSIIDSMPV